jgi:hypothetical protein
MTRNPNQERLDRVADRLAVALESTLTTFGNRVQTGPLSESEAVSVLTEMLQTRGIRLNDDLLHSLVARR